MKHYITDPPCAFIEAVVGGYSPIDKWTCHFARVAEKMCKEPWWTAPPWLPYKPQTRGELRWGHNLSGGHEFSGEIPWRTLHVETTAPGG